MYKILVLNMNIILKIFLVIAIIIVFLLFLYLASKIMVAVINRNLNKIHVNFNSLIDNSNSKSNKDENVSTEEKVIENFMSQPKNKIYQIKNNDLCEGFDNADNGYKSIDPTVFQDRNSICCLNHEKCKAGSTVVCNYGPTNYAFPSDMSPIDKKIFMLNYSDNFSLQDYVNWLKCFKDNKEELPYNHLKNLNKILNGEQLTYKKGVVPPPLTVQPEMCSEEYFNKLYNRGNNLFKLNIPGKKSDLLGYNYNEFPAFYQNYQQMGTTDRIYNVKDIKKKYSPELVNNFVQAKLVR